MPCSISRPSEACDQITIGGLGYQTSAWDGSHYYWYEITVDAKYPQAQMTVDDNWMRLDNVFVYPYN